MMVHRFYYYLSVFLFAAAVLTIPLYECVMPVKMEPIHFSSRFISYKMYICMQLLPIVKTGVFAALTR